MKSPHFWIIDGVRYRITPSPESFVKFIYKHFHAIKRDYSDYLAIDYINNIRLFINSKLSENKIDSKYEMAMKVFNKIFNKEESIKRLYLFFESKDPNFENSIKYLLHGEITQPTSEDDNKDFLKTNHHLIINVNSKEINDHHAIFTDVEFEEVFDHVENSMSKFQIFKLRFLFRNFRVRDKKELEMNVRLLTHENSGTKKKFKGRSYIYALQMYYFIHFGDYEKYLEKINDSHAIKAAIKEIFKVELSTNSIKDIKSSMYYNDDLTLKTFKMFQIKSSYKAIYRNKIHFSTEVSNFCKKYFKEYSKRIKVLQ